VVSPISTVPTLSNLHFLLSSDKLYNYITWSAGVVEGSAVSTEHKQALKIYYQVNQCRDIGGCSQLGTNNLISVDLVVFVYKNASKCVEANIANFGMCHQV
jgi:hypothetical protein